MQFAMSGRQGKAINLFREILQLLRTSSLSEQVGDYKHTYGYRYLTSLYRNSKDAVNANEIKDFQFLAETYICLLKSVRDFKKLYHRYKGIGEPSVEKIANRVGFKLPDFPR